MILLNNVMKATKKAIKQAIKEGSTSVYKLAHKCGIDVTKKELVLYLINQVNYMNPKHYGLVYRHNRLRDASGMPVGMPKGLQFWKELKNSGNYKKIAFIGSKHIWMCNPDYGHLDYNKWILCENNEAGRKKAAIINAFLNK